MLVHSSQQESQPTVNVITNNCNHEEGSEKLSICATDLGGGQNMPNIFLIKLSQLQFRCYTNFPRPTSELHRNTVIIKHISSKKQNKKKQKQTSIWTHFIFQGQQINNQEDPKHWYLMSWKAEAIKIFCSKAKNISSKTLPKKKKKEDCN